jgi:hypothetical protein
MFRASSRDSARTSSAAVVNSRGDRSTATGSPMSFEPLVDSLGGAPDCLPSMAAISCPLRMVPVPRIPSELASRFSSGRCIASSPVPLRLLVPSPWAADVTSTISVTCFLLARVFPILSPACVSPGRICLRKVPRRWTGRTSLAARAKGSLSTSRPDLEGASELGAGAGLIGPLTLSALSG